MVDALREAWRVLGARGLLIDLRPLSSTGCPLELVTAEGVARVGEVGAAGMLAEDRAADRAISGAVEGGLFEPLSKSRFEFEFSWDTVGEMAAYLSGSRRVTDVRPSYAELERLHREWRQRSRSTARLRYTRTTMIAAYRKVESVDTA